MSRALLLVLLPACAGGTGPTDSDGGTSSSSSSASSSGGDVDGGNDPICTPGASVFCRCADKSEAAKICNPDGRSFGLCAPCLDADAGP